MNNTRSTLYGLESLRGFAAILVVIYHISRHIERNHNEFPLGSITEFGHAGVNFFFVLSGFIILHVHYSDINKPNQVSSYLFKRFARIYPFYWIVVIGTLCLTIFSSSRSFPELEIIVKNLLLYPQGMDMLIVGVSWTLQYEVLFYLAFISLIINKRFGVVCFTLWLIYLLFVNFYLPSTKEPINIFSSTFNFLFFMGLACAYILSKEKVPTPLFLGLAGICMFFGIGAIEVWGKLDG